MGNKSSLLLCEEEIAQIQEETGCKLFFLYIATFAFIDVVYEQSSLSKRCASSKVQPFDISYLLWINIIIHHNICFDVIFSLITCLTLSILYLRLSKLRAAS